MILDLSHHGSLTADAVKRERAEHMREHYQAPHALRVTVEQLDELLADGCVEACGTRVEVAG